jgi:autotransporter-associated beta strand protein
MSARLTSTRRCLGRRLTRRLERLEDRLAPAVATWDGDGAGNNWTTAANWVGDVAPQPGDDLVFPLGAARPANVNDFIAGTAFHSIAVRAAGYQLAGNAIALAAGLSVEAPVGITPTDTPVIGLPLTLTADQAFSDPQSGYTLAGQIDPNGHALTLSGVGFVTVSGPITGTGSLTVSVGAVLSAASTFAGPTTVSSGHLDVRGTLTGPVTVLTSANGSGTLSGSGTVGAATVADLLFAGDALVFPRTAGTLKTGNLSVGPAAGTTFSILAPGSATGLAVTGTVQVGGTLNVVPFVGYQAHSGDRFTLINNDGTDPIVGTFTNASEGAVVNMGGTLFRITYKGGDGNDLVATAVPAPAYAVGAGPGGAPVVNVYSADGELVRSFFAYANGFRGGVRVATADVTGDGVPDIITGAGPGGGPHVRVFDGVTFAVVREFMAYDPAFAGGVFVAGSQINFDGHADIITGAGAGGGPHVKVFDGATGATLSSFYAYDPRFAGGVSVAGADSYSSLHAGRATGSVITGPGPGGGPDVRVFDGTTGALTLEFLAYDPAFRGGVNVACRGPLNAQQPGITAGAIVTAPASFGGPDVRLFGPTGHQIGGFLAYDPRFLGGVTVGVQQIDADGSVTLETGAGPGGGPHVKTWQVANGVATLQQSFFALAPAFLGGVFVG